MRTDGLQEALLKNPAVADSADRITKMKRVIKAVRNFTVSSNKYKSRKNHTVSSHGFPCPQLSQWKSLPNKKPLASVYVKLFGQEIAFADIDKVLIEEAIAV